MYVDASALCAVFLREEDCDTFEAKLVAASGAITSAISVWEAVRGVVRETGRDVGEARAELEAYLEGAEIVLVPIGGPELEAALSAFARFGKGRHPARLNMGDCFAYACAKTHRVPLLFKGDDFSQTDIPVA